MLIPVFKAGSPAAIAAGITAADLPDIAAFDCANNPVPNVIGHPLTNSPANGAVVRFEAQGDTLFADVPEKLPAFKPVIEGIKGGSILNRSMAFFGRNHLSNPTPGKIAPMHLGWLGGAAPGVAGLPPLASYFAANPDSAFTFSADGETLEVVAEPMDAVVLSPKEPAATGVLTITDPAAPAAPTVPLTKDDTMTPEEIKAAADKLQKDQEAHDQRVAAFAADQKTARETANASTVTGLVAAGKVLPADEKDLVAAFNAVDGGEVITFASDANKKGSPVSIIANILAKAGSAAPVGDKTSPDGENLTFSADGKSADELAKARADRMAKYGS